METQLKNNFFRIIIETVIIGFFIHGYGLLNFTISHDSITEFYYVTSSDWKIQIGRFLDPIYKYIFRQSVVLPWFVGLMGFIFIGLTVYMVSNLFEVRSFFLTTLVSLVFLCNRTVLALIATYLNDFDVDMAALFFAVLGVFVFLNKKNGFIWAAIFFACSLALYQGYILVSISLFVLYGLKKLYSERYSKVFLQECKAALSILFSVIIYSCGLYLARIITGISLIEDKYNSITNLISNNAFDFSSYSLHARLADVYYYFSNYNFGLHNNTPHLNRISIINVLLIIFSLFIGVYLARRKHIALQNVFFGSVLFLMFPVLSAPYYFIGGQIVHDLMLFSYIYLPLMAILAIQGLSEVINPIRCISIDDVKCHFFNRNLFLAKQDLLAVLLGVFLIICSCFNSIILANELYIKKDLDRQYTAAFMSDVFKELNMIEGYESGITNVCFVENKEKDIPYSFGLEETYEIVGMSRNNLMITNVISIKNYFMYIFHTPILIFDESELNDEQMIEFQRMATYPKNGYIRMIQNVVLIKY